MNEEVVARAVKIIEKKAGTGNDGFCTIALIDLDGYLTASTISVSKADGIRWLTFCIGLGPGKTDRIRKCDRASVCINSAEYNITLVGTIEVLTDPQVKKEMWYQGLEEHFSGVDDPAYCVLRFNTQCYDLLIDWKGASGNL